MNVQVRKGSVEFIIGIDLLAIAKDREGFMNYRHGSEWLAKVMRSLSSVESKTFMAPTRSTAQYAFTEERATGPTLSSFEAHGLMPVEVAYRFPDEYADVKSLLVQTKRFRVGSSGALSWTTTVELLGELAAQDYIQSMWSQFQIIENRFRTELGTFIEYWNERHKPEAMLEAPANVGAWLRRYEIHVLDIHTPSVPGFDPSNFKQIYSADELSGVLADVAAISRLSHVRPELYDPARLRELSEHDLANRRDELWLVNSARIVQVHPELDTKLVRSFFADVGLAIELLVQEKASLAFMEHWLDGVRGRACTEQVSRYGKELLDGHRALDKYVEPLYMLSASANPNFETAVERIAAEMGVIRQSERAIRSMSLMVSVSDTIATFGGSRNNHRVSRAVRSLTVAILILTVVQASVAVWLLVTVK